MLLVDGGSLLYHIRDCRSLGILDFIVKAAGTTFQPRHISAAFAKLALLSNVPDDDAEEFELDLEN